MKLNIKLIYENLTDFNASLKTTRDNTLYLRHVRLIESEAFFSNNLRSDYIYVIDAAILFDHIDSFRGLDVISVGTIPVEHPDCIVISRASVLEVFTAVQDIFDYYNVFDESVHTAFTKKNAVEYVCAHASAILKNPFVVLDISNKLLLTSGNIPEKYENTVWKQVLEQGYVVNPSVPEPIPEHFFKFAREVHSPPLPPYDNHNLMANIYVNNKPFGFLCSADIYEPFTEGQRILFSYVRDLLEEALVISLTCYEDEKTDYYIINLLKGIDVEERVVSYHLSNLGMYLKDRYVVYLITQKDGAKLEEGEAKYVMFRLGELYSSVILFYYEQQVVLISKEPEHPDLPDIVEFLESKDLIAGKSQVFDNFMYIKYYYIQAKAAISSSKGTVTDFESCYFDQIIKSVRSYTSQKSMCHPAVLRLLEYDTSNNTEYVSCLKIYLANGCNLSSTSKRIFAHRNTVEYWIKRIVDIIEVDPKELSDDMRMELLLSCILAENL